MFNMWRTMVKMINEDIIDKLNELFTQVDYEFCAGGISDNFTDIMKWSIVDIIKEIREKNA